MKKIFFSFLCFTFCFSSLFGSHPTHTINVKADVKNSRIQWKGSKITSSHEGNVELRQGFLVIDHGKLAGGKFSIDLSTIFCTDLEGKKAESLVAHLKDDDFFDVENHPIAVLYISDVKHIEEFNYSIKADLTIKGKTNPISFIARVPVKGAQFEASAKIVIDRTKWGIVYKSGNFFKDLAANKIIKDEIEFDIRLVSQKTK